MLWYMLLDLNAESYQLVIGQLRLLCPHFQFLQYHHVPLVEHLSLLGDAEEQELEC